MRSPGRVALGRSQPGAPSPRPSPGGARPRPRPQPEPAPPAEPRSPSRAAEPRRRRRPWDAGIAPPGPLSLRPVPGAPRRASPCRAAAAHPGTRAGGPAGKRAPPPAAPAGPESPLPAAAQLSSPRVGASNPCAPPPQPRVHRQAPSPISAPEGRGGRRRGAEQPGWRVSPGGGASLAGARPPPLPFPSGFPSSLSRAGGGGAAAPASRPILAQSRGGSGIGTRIPEAGDPKVRTATRSAVSVTPESGGTDRAGLGMKGPCTLLLGPAEQSAGAVLSG